MNISEKLIIRNANTDEFAAIGQLMVDVYSRLEGFPKQDEQPEYYNLLRNVGEFTKRPGTELLVAVNEEDELLGAVVFFTEMQYYGSGGTATQEPNACGFRLLSVKPQAQGEGIGKRLTEECIARAKSRNTAYLIIHTTKAMMTAWKMYEKMGFRRSFNLDFMQGELPVFGFRLKLT